MVGMDSHFYEQTSPLNPSFDSKASGRVPKCASPALQHTTHGSEGIPTDLNSPELTFDHMSIQQFIRGNELSANQSSSSNPILEESVSIFPNLLRASEKAQTGSNSNQISLASHHNLHSVSSAASSVSAVNSLHHTAPQHSSSHYTSSYQHHSQMPQQPSLGTDRYGLEASSLVKQEPHEADVDFSTSCSQNSLYSGPFAPNYGNDARIPNVNNSRQVDSSEGNMHRQMHFGLGSTSSASQGRHSQGTRGKHSSKKSMDKGTDEYKKRRERNNIAVRKSREKAKVRSRETEKKVSELARENDQLRKKVDSLCKELNVLKSLLTTVGVPPDSVDSEIAKGLQMDGHGFGTM